VREASGTWETLIVPESLEDELEARQEIRILSHKRGNPETEASRTLKRSGKLMRKTKQVGEPTKRREADGSQGVRSSHSTQRR